MRTNKKEEETSFIHSFSLKGKKAMMDDLFDLLFTVMMAFFCLLFIGFVLNGGINKANEKGLENVADFKKMDSAIGNLRVQSAMGTKLDTSKLREQIKESKILGGQTITVCGDYQEEANCQKDVVKVAFPDTCQWQVKEKKCITYFSPQYGVQYG